MGRRCQVCDGPVANGRCKLCGMPYRNDEMLYHLNENRSDHYRHASEKAKKIMRAQEIPLGDRGTPQQTSSERRIGSGGGTSGGSTGTSAGSAGTSAGTAGDRNAGRNAGGRETGRFAGERSAANGKQRGGSVSRYDSRKNWAEQERRKGLAGKRRKERSPHSGLIPTLFVILCVLGISGALQSVKEGSEKTSSDSPANFRESGENLGYLLPGQELVVGEEIPEGDYVLCVEEGYAQVSFIEEGDRNRSYESVFLGEDSGWKYVQLKEGERIVYQYADQEERWLEFYLLS